MEFIAGRADNERAAADLIARRLDLRADPPDALAQSDPSQPLGRTDFRAGLALAVLFLAGRR